MATLEWSTLLSKATAAWETGDFHTALALLVEAQQNLSSVSDMPDKQIDAIRAHIEGLMNSWLTTVSSTNSAYARTSNSEKEKPVKGFENIGENNCFLNAILQVLVHSKRFINQFLKLPSHKHEDNCIMCALTVFFDGFIVNG